MKSCSVCKRHDKPVRKVKTFLMCQRCINDLPKERKQLLGVK